MENTDLNLVQQAIDGAYLNWAQRERCITYSSLINPRRDMTREHWKEVSRRYRVATVMFNRMLAKTQ